MDVECRELTQAEVRELIADEARQMGLSYDEAMRRVRDGTLPKTALGLDIEQLAQLVREGE